MSASDLYACILCDWIGQGRVSTPVTGMDDCAGHGYAVNCPVCGAPSEPIDFKPPERLRNVRGWHDPNETQSPPEGP